ncbi:MAG TPA: 50S ribosomal protein L17 [Spirochaetota bacterium]|nr:50S ribosomal protein L17 [Spirochaetota bacterium]
MRHRNNVRILGRSHEHRKAMFANMVTSLFQHERIMTTKQKGKELKRIAERLITRAKANLNLTENDNAKKLHNKREVMRLIHNEDVVKKLFDDIAPRFVTRPGGYTRMYLLDRRQGDAAEMAIVELVVKTEKKQEEKKDKEKKNKEKKSNKTT